MRPKASYQLMLGTFSAALLPFGIWWNPLLAWLIDWALAACLSEA